MHYAFPIIRTIEDVLPHIEGRPEFVVEELGIDEKYAKEN